MSNIPQTYWHQLQGDLGHKVLFWLLNVGIVLSFITAIFSTDPTNQEQAVVVGVTLVVIQGFNAGVTYFSKERKALRE